MSRSLVLIALLSAAAVAGCATRPDAPPAYADKADEIRKLGTIAVLPVEIEITQVNVIGDNQRVPRLERRWTAGLVEKIVSLVEAKGFATRVVPADLPELATFRRSYTAGGNGSDARATFGEAARALANAVQADGLLLVHFSGYNKSGGLKARDAFLAGAAAGVTGVIAMAPSERGMLTAALVDGTTGNVLWMRHMQTERAPGREVPLPENPRSATSIALASLPSRVRGDVQAR
jgi:hypothetical protein